MPRMANLGKAVPPVVVLVLLLSGQRMTTVKPGANHSGTGWMRVGQQGQSTDAVGDVHGTFANFVSGKFVGLVLDVLDGGEVEVTGDASILLIKELHCLSCNVHHACANKRASQSCPLPLFNQEHQPSQTLVNNNNQQ